MSTTTTNLGLTLPTPNVDTGWGSTLNTDFTLIDNLFASNGTGTSIGLNVGSGKTLLLGGTMLLGTGDGTGTLSAATVRGPAGAGTNVTGTNLTFDASNGTGSGGSGKIIFRTAPVAANGTTPNTFRSSLEVNAAGGIGVNTANYGTAKQALLSGGASAAADWGNVDGSVINISGQARGDIIYRGASAWERLPAGTAGQFLKTNGSAADPSWSTVLTRSAQQTFVAAGNEFTGIPATATVITINFYYLYPTTDALIQIGTSSAYATTNYYSSGTKLTASGVNTVAGATGFIINNNGEPATGTVRLTSFGGNFWSCDYSLGGINSATFVGGGFTSLSGPLTRLKIIPSTGTLTNNGAVYITYM